MKFFIIIVLLLTIGHSISEKVRYDNYKLYKLTPKNVEAIQVLKELEEAAFSGYNFWSPVLAIGMPVHVMVPPYRVNELENIIKIIDVDSVLLMENVQDQIDAEDRPQTRDEGFGWTRYNTLDEINAWLRNLSVQYSSVVTLIQGGSTHEGRIIYGVKVSYSPNNANNSVFLESNIHARECTNAVIRRIAESYDWYVFPVFNPDGFEYSHTTDRMWRKTRYPHSILCTGADPNRNWDYFWNHGGTSNSPCTEIYRGPVPFSEPSTRSMAEFISSVGDQLVAYISFHSFSQLLLIPYGYTDEHLDNYEQIYQIGLKAAEALAQRYGTEYRVGTVYETIYPASGSSADWVKGVFNTPIVYTYELRDQGQYGFILPPEQIIPTALETLDSFITIFLEYENSISNK
ncbi:hypothetical protein NQ314_019568 [Rhamnusium bicolor]|uniref:Zinc carboxypeptidase A 1 n=1 Tax=Rhamnusium bicolor TaxID=1586634 RepID=A0AAV8WNS8_9CUCU|nr:hypothetical protein NQ314_019568 [Rhamnusium bicolor]